ncbi:hypothetical protein BU17DRAFT_92694 [Hysterangium stoloniferum]|nr:hypothetical protein BU17DRAFT_92694 [Hysterangium stoloniferum]
MNMTTLQAQQPTILRIKRKRTDEPLDALVVESKSRRKKSRGASGFFQFAETVEEETFWEDPSLTKDLRTRISTLVNGQGVPTEIPAESTPPQESPARRYTIVKKPAERKPPAPPIVHTASELQDDTGDDDFAVYDAVLEGAPRDEPMDDEMAKFLPMLQEYLRVNNEPSNISAGSAQSHNDEYVWDVFYHRPVITDWAAAANVATVSGLPATRNDDTDSGSDSAQDEDDEDSNTEDFYRNDYPDEESDLSNDGYSDLEEYPEVKKDEDDERELDAFMASRVRR